MGWGKKKTIRCAWRVGGKRQRRLLDPRTWLSTLSQEERVYIALRRVQDESRCATRTLKLVVNALRPFLKCNVDLKNLVKTDKKMQSASGASCLRLHGCVSCHRHIFSPNDKLRHCPLCQHPRFDDAGKPHEVAWYFPLRDQLKRLLSLSRFRQLLEHELIRAKKARYYTDVYDTLRWFQKIGAPTPGVIRIVLQSLNTA